MQQNMEESSLYDSTVDTDQAQSMQKAIALLMQQQAAQKPRVQRPDFSPVRGLILLAVAVLVTVLCFAALTLLKLPLLYGWLFVLLMLVCHAKKAALWLILFYQRYAPERLRAACVFTPTCSEYMRLAILKYGLLSGGIKGIKRLARCHAPNGGEDLP